MLLRIACAAFLMVASLAFGSPAFAAPSAENIYDRARERWGEGRYPRYLDYDVVVRVTAGASVKEERYASTFDATTARTSITGVSDFERMHPATGSGVRWCLQSCPQGSDVPDPDQDFIGVPLLAPNYSFGFWKFVPQAQQRPDDLALVQQIRAQFNDPLLRATPYPKSDLPTIATVTAHYRDYTPAIAGEDAVNGALCYHLRLQPKRDEARFRLRDLWVAEDSYATIRARVSSNFETGDALNMPWTIDYRTIDGATYLATERAEGPYHYGGRRYDSVELRFENLRERSRPPMPFAGLVANLILTEPSP